MTAAKIMDIISRLPGCAGQAADAVSASTQVKWKIFTNYWKFQIQNVQTFGFVYQSTNGQNHGSIWKIQSFLLNEICTVIQWQDCYRKGNLRKSYWNMDRRRYPTGNAYSYTVTKGVSYLCMWMTWKWTGKKHNIAPMWTVLNKEVDLGEQHLFLIMYTCDVLIRLGNSHERLWFVGKPTSFLDNVHLGCTQTECQIRKDIVDNYRAMFESRISAGWTEKTTMLGKNLRVSSWSYDMEGHAKRCVGRHCELAYKTPQCVGTRIVHSLLKNCSVMSVFWLVLGYRYFVVCEQKCSCSFKMNRSLW